MRGIYLISNTINQAFMLQDRLLYARECKENIKDNNMVNQYKESYME